MFRDTYKAANNDITPDSKLLAQTLSHIEQGRVRPVIPIRAIGACAAALMVTLGSVYAYVRYTDATSLDVAPEIVRMDTAVNTKENDAAAQQKSIQPTESEATLKQTSKVKPEASDAGVKLAEEKTDTNNTTRKNNTEAVAEKAAAVDKEAENDVGEPISGNTDSKTAAVPAEENLQPVMDLATADIAASAAMEKSIESAPSGDITPNNESENGNTDADVADVPVTMNSIEANIVAAESALAETTAGDSTAGASSGGGGGGGARASASGAAVQAKQITYGEYCVYIGADLYEELEMPEDVIADRWVTADFDRENDEVTLSYFGNEGRSARIIPTRNTDKIYQNIRNSQSDTKTDDCAFDYSESNAVAYIVSDGVGYTVNCVGFKPEEFAGLTDSILK